MSNVNERSAENRLLVQVYLRDTYNFESSTCSAYAINKLRFTDVTLVDSIQTDLLVKR